MILIQAQYSHFSVSCPVSTLHTAIAHTHDWSVGYLESHGRRFQWHLPRKTLPLGDYNHECEWMQWAICKWNIKSWNNCNTRSSHTHTRAGKCNARTYNKTLPPTFPPHRVLSARQEAIQDHSCSERDCMWWTRPLINQQSHPTTAQGHTRYRSQCIHYMYIRTFRWS